MRRIFIPFVIFLLLVLAWSGAWLWGAQTIRQEIAALGVGGDVTITCGRLDIAGFPFRFDVSCSDAVVSRGDLTLRSSEIEATALAYRPGHVIAFVASPVAISDAFFGTERELRFSRGEASLRLSGLLPQDFVLERLSVHTEGASLHDLLIGDEVLLEFTSGELHVTDSAQAGTEDDGLAAYARFTGLLYPEAEIANGTLTAEASASHFPRAVSAWTDPGLLRGWQAAGGELRLTNFELQSEALEIEATGDGRLDADGQPEGALRVTSRGLVERLDLSFLGDMQPLMTGVPDAGGRYTNQIALRDGFVLAGVIPVPVIELAIEPFF